MLKRLIITSALLFAFAQFSAADNWPQFRGPGGQGQSAEKGFPTTWSIKTGQNIRWKTDLPKSDNPFSSPIVWGDRVFATVSTFKTREHHVLCYDANTGKPLWDTIVTPGPLVLTDARGGYNAPTPCTDGQRVYVAFGSAVIACLDFAGQILWRFDMTDTAFDVTIGPSPILYKDTVIYLADQNQRKSRLLALDKLTGQVRYQEKRPDAVFAHSTPVLFDVNGTPQLLASAAGALQGIDPETGKVLWWFNTPGDVCSPVVWRNCAYIDSGRGSPGVLVDITGRGDVSKTHLKWRTPKQIPESLSSALIVGDCLYRLQPPGILKCFDLPSGKELYSQRIEGVSTWCSPVATQDGLIYLTSPGTSFVIRSGPQFELVSTNPLNDPNHAAAAFSAKRIYLKGTRSIYCISAP